MERRAFGNTGLMVSQIGLGMAALGRPGYINLGHAQDMARDYDVPAMESKAHQVLDAAWAAGIRYFDAARSYGLGERFLGNWLRARAISPDSVTIGSKWGYTYTADWKIEAQAHEIKDHSLATLDRQLPETLSFLNGYLKLYQVHSATAESGVLENRRVHDRLVQLKNDGIRIGLSLSGPEQAKTLRHAMEITIDGVRLFDSVQATWNVLEPSVGPALMEAHSAGMGIIIKEALANGRLTERNKVPGFASKLAVLQSEAGRLGVTIDALVLAASLCQPFADVVLSGATNADQLASNVQACRLRIDGDTVSRLLTLGEEPARYWATRSQLPWN